MIKKDYPENWPEISEKIKARHNYCCERCGHHHDPKAGYTLTVHHLDGDSMNNEDWNLAALCQRCHLKVQAYVEFPGLIGQLLLEEYKLAGWLEVHVQGYLAWRKHIKKIQTRNQGSEGGE